MRGAQAGVPGRASIQCFHKLECGLALVGELPAVRVPFDQSHRENTQPQKISSQSAGSIRPISAARCEELKILA
jgi:hypothetical protein